MYGLILFVHVLGATVWIGGHLFLAICILPGVLKRRDPDALLAFEHQYERLGMSALVTQVLTGVWLAFHYVPDFAQWFNADNALSRPLLLKMGALLLTVLLAVDAQWRVLPRLGKNNLWDMALHVIAMTALGVGFAFAGVAYRTGWLF